MKMPILDILEQFKTEYTKLISDFSVIDEQDPITSLKLNQLNAALDSWVEILLETFQGHKKYLEAFEEVNQSALKHYKQKIKALNTSLNKNIKNITLNHVDACQKLKHRIEVARQNSDYTIEQLEIEYNFFITTSEQNKNILAIDFEEAKKRYDYQRDEAKESYLEIVRKNNKSLEIIKQALEEKHLEETALFEQDNLEVIDKLKKLIDLKTIELTSITTALENEKNNMKERYRQESANLNDNVKKIAEEKNKMIDKARSQYNKAMNDATIEKENKKAVYQSKSQALLKEFVTKINVIDENTAKLKKEFDRQSERIKHEYYTLVFNKTRVFHQQLEQIYSSAASSLDKYTNHLIRYKNKQHNLEINLLKKENEVKLLELTRLNTMKVSSNKNDKNFLEIDKNYSIKSITDQEQFDNKYYQEKSSVYENDFNYTVKSANYRFAQQANILRCQSQIRTKLLERNYDGIEANYYKKIETIQNKINAYKLEIELTEAIKSLIQNYQEEAYQSHLHLEEVTSLLEIEKNKLLKEYNGSQYEFNTKNIALTKEYGLKKIDLENQRAEKFKNLKITLENLLLEKNSVSTAYSIKKEELNERFSKLKTQLINSNDLKVTKEKYISRLKNNDVHYMNQLINSYNNFFDSFKRNFLNVIGITLKDVYPDSLNHHYLETFINSFLKIFISFYQNSFACLTQEVISVIDKKMDFIYEFKYKSSLDSLKEEYLSNQAQIKETKNNILDKIDSYNKTIENFRQKIYTLINDNEMLIQNNTQRKRKLDAATQAAVKSTELKIKDYRGKIDNFIHLNKMHNDDLAELNQKLAENSAYYKRESSRIAKMMKTDLKIYIDLKKNVEAYGFSMEERARFMTYHYSLASSTARNLYSVIDKSQKALCRTIQSSKDGVLKLFTDFARKCSLEITKKKMECSKEFQEEIAKYNRQYNKAIQEYQHEYKETISTYESKVNEHNLLMQKTLGRCDAALHQAEIEFQNACNALDSLQEQITYQFFASYYALEDNFQKIVEYHAEKGSSREETFKTQKQKAIKENTNQKNEANNKLKSFIKTKNEEIEHLPIAFKFNSRLLNNETKKKNILLHEDLKAAKNTFNVERKRIDKEINNLNNQLSQDKFENEYKQKKAILQEKKNNLSTLKQAMRSIKIDL